MKKRFALLYILFLLLQSSILSSNTNQAVFENLSVDKGLSHSDVTAIVQDQTGFIWFGTYNGLCKYNGNEIQVYRSDNSTLSNNRVQCLYASSDSLLYIGTEIGGLNIYNTQTDSFQSYRHQYEKTGSISGNTIFHIFEDQRKNIWLCSNNGISQILTNKDTKNISFQSYYLANNDKRITSGCAVNDNLLLLGTNNGLLSFNTKSYKYESFYPQTINGHIYTIQRIESTNDILIGTKSGLFKYCPSKAELSFVSAAEVLSIIEDSKGNIWVGTRDDGLYMLNKYLDVKQSFQADISRPDYITNNEIQSLFEDKSGVLWIGTIGDGVFKKNLASKPIQSYTIESKINGKITYNRAITFVEAKDGLIWIGTRGKGIEILDRKTNRRINLAETKKININLEDVSAFFQDKNGAM